MANALAYYDTATITAVKSFIVQATGFKEKSFIPLPKDGTCTVDYIPTEEGDYDINVKFGDEHIPGSPFKVSSCP